MAVVGKIPLDQLLGVVDGAHRGDAERARCERTSSGCGSVSLMQPMPLQPWKPCRSSSKRVRNGVFSIEWISRWKASFLRVVEDHARAFRSQVGVIVHAEEHVQHHVVVRRRPKESAHCLPFVVPAANPCQQNISIRLPPVRRNAERPRSAFSARVRASWRSVFPLRLALLVRNDEDEHERAD